MENKSRVLRQIVQDRQTPTKLEDFAMGQNLLGTNLGEDYHRLLLAFQASRGGGGLEGFWPTSISDASNAHMSQR